MAATTPCAATANADRANNITAGPGHVTTPAARRSRMAAREFGAEASLMIDEIRIGFWTLRWNEFSQARFLIDRGRYTLGSTVFIDVANGSTSRPT